MEDLSPEDMQALSEYVSGVGARSDRSKFLQEQMAQLDAQGQQASWHPAYGLPGGIMAGLNEALRGYKRSKIAGQQEAALTANAQAQKDIARMLYARGQPGGPPNQATSDNLETSGD